MLVPFADATDVHQVKQVIEAKRAVQEHPDSVEAHRQYQNVMIDEGWKAQILEEYAGRLKKQRTAENLYLWARLQEGTEEIQAFETLVKEFPEFSWGYFGLAAVRAREGAIKEFEPAVAVGERYLSSSPTDRLAWVRLAQSHLALYDRHRSADHLLAAEQACEHAIASDPAAVDAYYALYDYFSDRKWWVHALYYNNRALKLTEQGSPAYDALEHNRSWIPAHAEGMGSGSFRKM